MRRILDRAQIIATVSEFTRTRLLKLFHVSRPERIVVIGNGGAEDFCARTQTGDESVLSKYGLRRDAFVLCPGSLTWRKGGDLVLDTAHRSIREAPGLQFVVVGRRHDADLLAQLMRLKRLKPELPVAVPGYVPRADLAALYRHAKATLVLSRYEGFGMPVVEALASGSPVVISSQPALVEAANGRATVVSSEPLAVLNAIARASRTAEPPPLVEHTWSRCADRLVGAMRMYSC